MKLEDRFTYLGRWVSSTESDSNMRGAKAWTASDSISTTCFLPSSGCENSAVWMNDMDADEAYWEKLDESCTRMLQATLDKSWKQHSMKQDLWATYLLSFKPSKWNEQGKRDFTREVLHSTMEPFIWTCQCAKKNIPTTALNGHRM